MNMTSDFLYSIEVFDDYAIIRGRMPIDVLNNLICLCEIENFKFVVRSDDEYGLKLVREVEK